MTHFTDLPLSARVAQRFGAAAEHYDEQALAQRQSAECLIDGLSTEGRFLDIGCGTGWLTRQLVECNPQAQAIALDIAAPMLAAPALQHPRIACVQANAARLPVSSASMNLVISNFALQWLESPAAFSRELHRVLTADGRFVLAIPVDGTLSELNQAWHTLDQHEHINRFFSCRHWLSALAEAGLIIRTYRQQAFYQYYPSVMALLKSLKAIGANELQQARRQGLWTRGQLNQLEQAMTPFRTAEGVPLSYQVLMVWGNKESTT